MKGYLSRIIIVSCLLGWLSFVYADQAESFSQSTAVTQNRTDVANYYLGELYDDGVIVYLEANGAVGHRRGLVAALTNAANATYDSSNNSSIYNAAAQSYSFFGGSNINGYISGYNSYTILHGQYCANASNCAAYSTSMYTGSPAGTTPAGTWYLPSRDELVLILEFDSLITQGEITNPVGYQTLAHASGIGGVYWSSTEYPTGPQYAWVVDTTYGSTNINFKSVSLSVRPVRAFTY